MNISKDDAFCSSTFLDPAVSWDTEDPDLSLCFEKTVLTWTPCLVLWLATPLEICLIQRSKCRDIPWRAINLLKLVGNLALIGVSAVSLVWSIFNSKEENIYPVDVWTPAIQTASFLLTTVILLWNRVRGRHTSGVLFFFFLLLTIGGAVQFRTELRLRSKEIDEESNFKFILYMIYYPIVVVMLILNLFPDPPPRETFYPQSKKLCPEVHASYASRVLFAWFDRLIWKGFKSPLTVADLWDLRFQDTAGQIIPRFEKYWFRSPTIPGVPEAFTATNGKSSSYGTLTSQRNRSRKPISILGPTIRVLWLPIITAGVVKLSGDMLAFVNPQLLNVMIKFVAGKEYMWRGILYAVGMLVSAQLQTICFHQSLMTMYIVGLNWRTALMSAVYRKALRISNSARKTSTVGEVVNLMAVDAQRCADFAPFAHMLWTSPITIAVALYFLWQILGPSTLAGLAVMIIIIPVNSFIANKVKFLQMKQMKYKDERVKLMNEVLSGIKVLKLYAWEPSFKDYISKIREKELKLMRRAALLNASTSFVWGCSSFLVSLATFGVYVLVDEHNVLTVEIAFVATALFNVMRAAISFFPMMIQLLVQSIVSVKRINRFLNAEELDFNSVSHDESKKEPLIIDGGSFSWGTEKADAAVLRNITLKVNPGSLVAVVGAVGAGKSSLISAFLGEMDKISGYVNTKGSIAYVPQQAWIQNATVRDNILFGSAYDAKRYYKTIESCSLKQDLDMLPGGDKTEIGEKGINLSGGQKQRVSLARAVYNDADTYLLDDPLSAVDSHVGKHIFENVIGPKGVLSRKTRVMVTHGVTFLPQVDVIVVMKNGEIIETGTFKELLNNKGEFSDFLVQHITESKDELEVEGELEELIEENPTLKVQIQRQLSKSGSVRSTSSSNFSHRKASTASEENIQTLTSQIDKLIQAEKTETGSVKLGVYMHYLKSAGLLLSVATLGFQLVSQALGIASNIWLSDWSSDTSAAVDGVQDKDKRNFYLEVYTALGFSQMAAVIAGAYALAFGTVLASRYLHSSMLGNILHCPMSFFDTTPTGRLVNRFGKDVDVIDNTLPFTFSTALTGFGNVIGTIVVITYSTPLFATVILPVGLLYYGVQKVYITTSRQLKRIESVSRSPVYSHFSETVSGATSIRAYKVVDRFIKTSEDRVDANQVCLYPSLVSNRWLGIRLETVGNILIFFAALFAVLGRDKLDAGLVGLSISYALQITGMLNLAVRMSSEVETNIVSVERIKEYSEVPTEAAWVVEPRPDAQWPSHGTVQFQDYQVRYRDGLDLVLRGVSFVVNGGEKIGIVGRTGAGKSSLTLCLFRILEAAGGQIFIDGLNISKIGLGDLRSKLTIIPQDPVLFSGSLRMNLDPFEKYSDSDIWRALEHAHLSVFARGLAAGLNHTISEGGDNLSVGQRQLICLARALLRKTKVLILDEATAAIDLETDDIIQQTIRREFKDCTVLTIAHRLNTIMDSDRVIVLDKGTIKEFDSPQNLLSSSSTIFHGMAKDAGLV
ncbi:ATP-binding cassette sub-family C member 3-like [Macrosteles quadrilineatus]|uniref:ATP-binding cassette sub-family C member 3-like n=1 Tax=Macrosteles quadrilineatus TaxID=74068 RepID=UPI0023E305FC|nr:ATP-binding cassette sub-family C member 3-like [Macrosteles quadrilineatus]